MTTASEIGQWFDRGVSQGSKYMLIICDTFDWEDYPYFFEDEKEAREKMSNPGDMNKFMEAYDLSANKDEQLNMRRANCFIS